MSYSYKVVVTDGKPAVDEKSVSGTVPDGTFYVSGHEDDNGRSIGVSRKPAPAETEMLVIQAQGWAARS